MYVHTSVGRYMDGWMDGYVDRKGGSFIDGFYID